LDYKAPVEEMPNHCLETVPLLSVVVITYQHAPYIRECLDGILMQETNFAFEIILGEDASTDGTREICVQYAKAHPGRIRLFLHNRENIILVDGKTSGQFNFLHCLNHARGKYIAICEGDDYWTDPNKLQMQVNFLEANPDYSICFHYSSSLIGQKLFPPDADAAPNETTRTEDLIIHSSYISTASVVLRIAKVVVPEWLAYSKGIDYGLFLCASIDSKIKLIPKKMSVHRQNPSGIWTTLTEYEKKVMLVSQYKKMVGHFSNSLNELVLQRIAEVRLEAARAAIHAGEKDRALEQISLLLQADSPSATKAILATLEHLEKIVRSRSYRFAILLIKIKKFFFR